ncbi:hypothetical protein BOX15_Mlig021499g1, partial [Macrostomum lignano]
GPTCSTFTLQAFSMRLLLFVSVFILAASGISGAELVKLQGCYVHVYKEVENLKYRISTSESMTIESCQKDCSRYTFRYFGVARTECFCGDSKIAHKISLNRCNYRCPGNPKQICGGINSMVVYEQPATLVTASAEHPNFKLQGCYVHVYKEVENLKYRISTSESMTIESCQKDCSRYTFRYFGVATTECFCGDSKIAHKISLNRCNYRCPGNPKQICGGINSMVVYEQPATLVTASAEHPNFKLQGCYVHLNNEDENLKYRISTSESMTIESCQKDCSRYTYRYFGVANKTECYCGDSLRKEQTSNECNYRCPGNLKQICGGSEYMVVYEQPDILPAASAEHQNFKLEGCYFHYDDPSSNLRRYKSSNESMTIESCQKDCSVTTDRYFGVISGTHCYCGDLIMSAQLSLKKCDYRCPGNPKQICGGSITMVVYEQPASAEHPNFKLLGCYLHSKKQNNLRLYISSSESMTIESCRKDCSVTTAPYFGVISGTYCYCGESVMGTQLSLRKCDYRCPGNPKQICGGFDSMVVYEHLL